MRFNLVFLFVFLYTSMSAKEGMWLPFLLKEMNQSEMRQMGLKIKAKDIYDVNEGSLKDAVVIFGAGCTGEVISEQGLVLTNHHCGYGTVQGLSSLENNYLTQGFWAKNNKEELPCPGLSVTFIIKIDDVTKDVLEGVNESMADSISNKLILGNISKLEKSKKKETGYETLIKSFFYDNQYYLFYMEKYNDIRLVGFPPKGIGKYGGDTDNWAWPRHTGDFGVFRIYADENNKPTAYNINNKPFIPRRSFKINIEGVKEDDFTWVYGFPGRTSEYLSSDGVAEVMEVLDPARIEIREERLNIMNADMKKDEKTFIQYASKQASIANYYKKWKGELLGLQKNNAIAVKKKQEGEFTTWVNADDSRKQKYGNILQNLKKAYEQQKPFILKNEFMNECIWASEVLKKGSVLDNIMLHMDSMKNWNEMDMYHKEMKTFYNGINTETDVNIAKTLWVKYIDCIEPIENWNNDLINAIYTKSLLANPDGIQQLLSTQDKDGIKQKILTDIGYKTYAYFVKEQAANMKQLKVTQLRINSLYKTYIQGLMEFKEGEKFYPDANSTLRVSYGKVHGLDPQDGMTYKHYTTLDGALAKYNHKVEEFQLPAKLMELYNNKDYGEYVVYDDRGNKTVPLAFLASNHTTGGNSGSPVLNARGELIGTNFDRIWEGTMSDIMYDINLCRNITLDVRYTLFIIEKFGGARWLIDEMDIVR